MLILLSAFVVAVRKEYSESLKDYMNKIISTMKNLTEQYVLKREKFVISNISEVNETAISNTEQLKKMQNDVDANLTLLQEEVNDINETKLDITTYETGIQSYVTTTALDDKLKNYRLLTNLTYENTSIATTEDVLNVSNTFNNEILKITGDTHYENITYSCNATGCWVAGSVNDTLLSGCVDVANTTQCFSSQYVYNGSTLILSNTSYILYQLYDGFLQLCSPDDEQVCFMLNITSLANISNSGPYATKQYLHDEVMKVEKDLKNEISEMNNTISTTAMQKFVKLSSIVPKVAYNSSGDPDDVNLKIPSTLMAYDIARQWFFNSNDLIY